ncbi:unnamed protein product [Phaedon cochleariae]|uniref:ENTH domain-containing protein n=1 Tax=Phaedon cochleariae TaxID=80249 RepID=A0A9P0DMI6_PHACE|nr:unnamed protein product [Phaedon cochleariae]
MENFFPSMWKVREIADKVTNVVMNYTEVEAKVREATNDEAWGPTGQIMQELAHSTFTYEHFPEVMSMLWKRMLQDNKQHWRRTYKSLQVLSYLVKNGSERVVTSAREHIYDLRSLENYTYIDDVGKDQGINIRHKVKELIDFIQDDDRLREERKKAKKNKDKFIGMSSDTIGMRFGGSARETWDDRPYSRETSREANDWDEANSPNRYRDRTYDEEYDIDKEDSDPELKNTNNADIKKYQDADLPTSPTRVEKKVNININPSLTHSPKKSSKPLKKVDLGAAANFGRDTSQSPMPRASGNLLNDDFDPRASEPVKDRKESNEFGEFESAFGGAATTTSQKPEDDFADFSSAFSQAPQNTSQYSSIPNLMGPGSNVVPPPSSNGPNLLMGSPPPNLLGGSATFASPPLANNLLGTSRVPAQSTQSNSDLLGDLGGFGSMSIQPQPAPTTTNNNFGLLGNSNIDLLDGLSSDTNKGDTRVVSVNVFGEHLSEVSRRRSRTIRKSPAEKELTDLLYSVVQNLEKNKKITSQDQVDDLLSKVQKIVELLPGPLTVQKLAGMDESCSTENIEDSYEVFIECLVQHFDANFPFRDNKIYEPMKQLFLVEDVRYFTVNFKVLLHHIDEHANIEILRMLLDSDAVFVSICHYILGMHSSDELSKEEISNAWKNFVTHLISLPSRMANILSGNVPELFLTEQYANYLIFNLLKTVEFLSELLLYKYRNESGINYEWLSYFVGRLIVDYNERLKSKGIINLIQIIAILTNKPSNKAKLYQSIFQNLLLNLDRSAIDIFAKMFLSNLDPQNYSLKAIFGNDLINNEAWKYVLCTKIPLLTYFERDYSKLIINLVVYVSSTSPPLTMKLFIDLLSIWADRSSINHTSIEQQIFITKVLLFNANSLRNIGFSEYEATKIREIIFSGLPVHLESSNEIIRAIGMKTGEILINLLHEETEKSENELKFQYNNLKIESKNLVSELQDISDEDIQCYFKPKTDFKTDLGEILSKLSRNQQNDVIEYIPPERQFHKKIQTEEPKNEFIITDYKTDSRIKIIDSTGFELDSDDDLEPYDLSNDVKVSKKNPPAYLRDLRDGLLESQDQEIFSLNLENCEKIITSQLSDDDPSIGLEILEILLSLEPRFYVENFDDLVFQSCVAISYVYPACYVEFLCKQIHADIGTYSISKRVFMLDILRQTARNLSTVKESETKVQLKKTKRQGDIDSAEEVIRKRLENKTRYFSRHKYVINEHLNKFAEVAGHFFFPLLYGYNQNRMLCQSADNDSDCILLIHFIETLAVVMCASQNCPIAPRMAKEIFHFSWFLRFHKEVRVRISILTLISSAIVNIPQSILVQDFLNELFEIRLWLIDLLSPNVAHGEPNLECRNLAACAIVLIEGVLKVDVDLDNES